MKDRVKVLVRAFCSDDITGTWSEFKALIDIIEEAITTDDIVDVRIESDYSCDFEVTGWRPMTEKERLAAQKRREKRRAKAMAKAQSDAEKKEEQERQELARLKAKYG